MHKYRFSPQTRQLGTRRAFLKDKENAFFLSLKIKKILLILNGKSVFDFKTKIQDVLSDLTENLDELLRNNPKLWKKHLALVLLAQTANGDILRNASQQALQKLESIGINNGY